MFDSLFDSYESYKESSITKRIIPLNQWNELLEKWNQSPYLSIQEIGKTFEGEPIHEFVWGKGPIKVAAWSQMHGDEATATMALADVFRYLTKSCAVHDALWENLHQHITFHCIPYLNKDGAKRWQRETALGIDMNRDAKTLNTPEAKILSDWADRIQPTFSFNLHDQNRLYSAGKSAFQTKIALLATAADEQNTWTPSRIRAGKLANYLSEKLIPYIGPHLAKWSDDYEPRAFGDTFQARGYGLILFEAGGMQWDIEKNYLRKLTACMLLDSLRLIATNEWEIQGMETYKSLPTNEKSIGDIKINRAPLTPDGNLRADLMFNLKETLKDGEIQFSWILEEIGDLSHLSGLTEINGENLTFNSVQKLELGKEYHNFYLKENESNIFNLSDFTQKLNK